MVSFAGEVQFWRSTFLIIEAPEVCKSSHCEDPYFSKLLYALSAVRIGTLTTAIFISLYCMLNPPRVLQNQVEVQDFSSLTAKNDFTSHSVKTKQCWLFCTIINISY